MSENSDSVQPNFCIECKSDLSKESHLKNCKSQKTKDQEIVENDATLAAQKLRQENEKAEQQKRDQEQEEILRKELEAQKAKDEKLKQTLIDKIIKLDPKGNLHSLKSQTLESLKVIYKAVIETHDDVTRKITRIKTSCPKCKKFLGVTTTLIEFHKVLNDHKKECPEIPRGTSTALKLVLGLAILGLALGSVFAYQNPHLFKKKPCSDCDKEKKK